MKGLFAIALLCLSLLLFSCRTGDLLTVYSERTAQLSSVNEAEVGTEAKAETGTDAATETETETGASATSRELTLISMTETVEVGAMASVEIRGEPNTVYSISVFYSSGESSASGLEAKLSDNDGGVSWSWRVGSRTKSGRYRVVISGDGADLTLYFTVTRR